MKITRPTDIHLQGCDISRIFFGDPEGLDGLPPDAFFEELFYQFKDNDLALDNPPEITVPADPGKSYRFAYRFVNPEVRRWIQRQRWLLELSPLVRRTHEQLICTAMALERSAGEGFSVLVTRSDELSEAEVKSLRRRIQRLLYKATSMRIVAGEREGRWKMARPLPESICQALAEPVGTPVGAVAVAPV